MTVEAHYMELVTNEEEWAEILGCRAGVNVAKNIYGSPPPFPSFMWMVSNSPDAGPGSLAEVPCYMSGDCVRELWTRLKRVL